MSRSRKKHGVIKDRGLRRADYNRRFRRVNKQRIQMGKDPYQLNELVESWDVCDWKQYWDSGWWKYQFENYPHSSQASFYKDMECAKRAYFRK